MIATAPAKRVLDVEELTAFARQQRERLSTRYRTLAVEMRQIGAPELEDIFGVLAKDMQDAAQSADKPPQDTFELSSPSTTTFDVREGPERFGLWNAYAVWAYAVHNEVQAFEQLTSLNVPIDAGQVRTALAEIAQACLARAARYRVNRRRAFHAERRSKKTAQFPDVRRIDTVEDFAHVALAIERYFLALTQTSAGSDVRACSVVRATERVIAKLEHLAEAGDAASRLRNALKRLAALRADKKSLERTSGGDVARLALEADRIFDFYDRVFESSLDPEVTAAAQTAAADTVERLRILKQLDTAA